MPESACWALPPLPFYEIVREETSEWLSIISVIIFEVNIIAAQKRASLATIFLKVAFP